MDGLTRGSGKYGYESIQLDTNGIQKSSQVDILVDFEQKKPSDVCGNYTVESFGGSVTSASKIGKGAGFFRGKGGYALKGGDNSIFGVTGRSAGSFLIEFWLCPSIAENGETVLSWRSSRTRNNFPLYQMIMASFINNHLQWEFTNVFNGYTENSGTLKVTCSRTIIPNVWSHHAISFDDTTGLLEYRIDGLLEDIKYVTSNGRETGGYIYTPILGVAADIEICPKYSGKIDDFSILRTSENSHYIGLNCDAYRSTGGRFESEPLLVSRGAVLKRIDAIVSEPAQTDVVMYVRSGDNYFNWNDYEPEWKPVKNHAEIDNVSGKYFQVAAEFYPDGKCEATPSISEIKIVYTEVSAPLPPFTLVAEPGNGQVTLTWAYSVDDTAGGYLLFYGERPGEYLGYEAVQGESPVDVGNVAKVTVKGLKNGKIYYFALASYSKDDRQIVGILSDEVYARPLRK